MRLSILATAAVLSLAGLSACSQKTQDSVENAGSSIGNDLDSAIDRAGDKIDNGLDHAGRVIDGQADRIGTAAENATREAEREAADARHDVGTHLEKAGSDLKKP